MLGPGNDEAALSAVKAWPSGLQVGGGITDQNACQWIEAGAEKVCIAPTFGFLLWPQLWVLRPRALSLIERCPGHYHFISLSRSTLFPPEIESRSRCASK